MAGETTNIAEAAEIISREIFDAFKWTTSGPPNENFACLKVDKHKPANSSEPPKESAKHQHPCDVVFKYFDPYLSKNIYLLTDLKSFAKSTMSVPKARATVKLIAKSIECAKVSEEWQDVYVDDPITPWEVRGLLFIFNHDGKYEKDFIEEFSEKLEKHDLGIEANQQIHIIDPKTVNYLKSIVIDLAVLRDQKAFSRKENYTFFYPEMSLNKVGGDPRNHSGIVEVLSGPFMVIKSDGEGIARDPTVKSTNNDCYLIYYRQQGGSDYEFVYLLDYLSKWQILNSGAVIHIRVINPEVSPKVKSNFEKAKNRYLQLWGDNSYRRETLDAIKFDVVTNITTKYVPATLGWRHV